MNKRHLYTPLDELSRLGEVRESEERPACEPFAGGEPYELDARDFVSEPTEKDRIGKAVSDLRKQYGIGERFNAKDFYRICAAKNIRVMATPEFKRLFEICTNREGNGLRGLYLIIDKTIRVISMRCLFETEFDRFCAAHELGHALLGHTGNGIALAFADQNAYRNSIEEREANYFAQLLTA